MMLSTSAEILRPARLRFKRPKLPLALYFLRLRPAHQLRLLAYDIVLIIIRTRMIVVF